MPVTHTRARTGHHAARLVGAALVAMAFLVGGALPVRGWANNGDGYSTHDWFIDQAVKVLDGRADDWFVPSAARLASDDPDTVPALADGVSHVYRETGLRGGAVQRVSEHYSAAAALYRQGVVAREAGDAVTADARFREASTEIGLLSHYYTDILQPYHSAYAGLNRDGPHIAYELLIDEVTHRAADSPGWQSSSRSVATIANVRTTTIAAAAYSRAMFADLHASFTANQAILSAKVRDITGRLARRGAQDLANIIYSISRSAGESPDVASLRTHVKWVFPAASEPYQGVYVTARDAGGRAIEGLEVTILWPLAGGGTRTARVFTDPSGAAKYVAAVGGGPLLVRRTVTVSATATLPAATRTATTWFMATPRLADGSAGFKTAVRDATVKAGETVFITSRARDTAGRPVKGLLVTWTWRFGTKIVTTSAWTGEDGRARTSRLIRTTTTRSRVTVTAHVQAASSNRYSSTSFRRP
jgi:hypothetical protein